MRTSLISLQIAIALLVAAVAPAKAYSFSFSYSGTVSSDVGFGEPSNCCVPFVGVNA
jgi:hypothetical protein